MTILIKKYYKLYVLNKKYLFKIGNKHIIKMVERNWIYYTILLSTFLITFSFVPLTYEIVMSKMTRNIPYISIFGFFVSFVLVLLIAIMRGYYIHVFLYLVVIISLIIIVMNKLKYDDKDVSIEKTIEEIRHIKEGEFVLDNKNRS